MTNLADLASSAVHAGKNIILTNALGVGNVTSITNKIKEEGFKLTTISLAYDDSSFYGLPLLRDGKVELKFPQTMLDADVIIFDQAERASSKSMAIVEELMADHTVLGSEFANLKSVIVIFTENGEHTDKTISRQRLANGIASIRLVNLAS